MKTDLFQSCGHCWPFQICWHVACSTLTASSLRIWNSSTGIPSPPLALLVVQPALIEVSSMAGLPGWPSGQESDWQEETWVQLLGREDPLEEGIVTHSSILAWKIPWTEEPGRLQSMGSQRVGHNWVNSLSLSFLCFQCWRKKQQINKSGVPGWSWRRHHNPHLV